MTALPFLAVALLTEPPPAAPPSAGQEAAASGWLTSRLRAVKWPPPCRAGGEASPQEVSDGDQELKTSLTLSCTWRPAERLRLGVNLKAYPIAGQQRPWDSDFNIQAGYELGQGFALEYADYSGNRWSRLARRISPTAP